MNFKKIFKLWLKFIQHILWRKILHKPHFFTDHYYKEKEVYIYTCERYLSYQRVIEP